MIKMMQKEIKKPIIYTTPTCHYCHLVKKFFKEKNIEFTEIDVSKNIKIAKEMIRKSGQMGVPQIEINGKIILGFNKAELEEEIAKLKS
jgi:glutaredoxin 3